MRTKCITYALAQRVIILSILALIASFPVFSQVSFASFKSISYTAQDKKFNSGFQNNITLMDPGETPAFPMNVSFFATIEKSVKGEETVIYSESGTIKKKIRINNHGEGFNDDERDISIRHTSFTYPENTRADIGIDSFSDSELLLYATLLKQYARKKHYDTTYAFLSNMGMKCNKKRFYVVNLETMKIESSGLVSQGRGQAPSVFDRQYSNRSGSRCTSLGRYKILNKYKGGYGLAYRVAGLDSSNENAYSRHIVLHSMGCIPDKEGMLPACVSEGCPAVSVSFLSDLGRIIDSRKMPILLWIFDSKLEEAVLRKKPDNDRMMAHHNCTLHSWEQPSML